MAAELRNWAVIGVVGVIWLALILVGVVSGDLHQLGLITELVPLLFIAAALFERWGWRWSVLHPYIVSVPVIRGTWHGQLVSLWEDPKTGSTQPAKTAYLAVEQSLTETVVRLITNESSSDQIVGSLRKRPGGRHFVSAIYQNKPRIDRRAGSPIHFGAVMVDILGRPPSRLEGEYWTERESKGILVLTQYSPKIAETYDEAESLFPSSSHPAVAESSDATKSEVIAADTSDASPAVTSANPESSH
jgi:hypothetical protein